MRSILLDTGALIALLDRSDRNHLRCITFFEQFRGTLLTTEPVLTETLYLLSSSIQAQKNGIAFLTKGAAILVPQSLQSLSRASDLMEKYKNAPMHFADATLVALGEEAQVSEIFTLDRRGFEIYRLNGKKHFTIWPE